MRNLKKVLSLVLALAMALSLMTVALAADKSDFVDADEITYTEAVDVLQALGILGGDDSGNFNPTGVLTREGAAKIICYLLMGSTAADNLSTTTAPFNDVPANRWSAGYIAYCKTQGIVGGDGTGNFNPNGEINAYGFAKMLLVALGYDANIEQFGGSDWTINVARLANVNGLFEGNDAMVGTGTMTREEASLYAFNTLKADMVEYNNRGVEITQPDGSVIVVNASPADKVTNKIANDYRVNGDDRDSYMQLCEQYFKDLKLTVTYDDFGRPANQWKVGSKTLDTYSKAADLTYTKETKVKDIYADLGKPSANTVRYILNGAPQANVDLTVDGAKLGGNGVLLEVYEDTYTTTSGTTNVTTEYTIVAIEEKVGTISKVTPAKGSDPATVNVSGVTSAYETTGYEVDDVVVYTLDNNNKIATLRAADAVVGTLTSYNTTKNTLVVGGTTYDIAKCVTSVSTLLSGINIKDEVRLYLDQYGYVVQAEVYEANGVRNYAYVLATGTSGDYDEGDANSDLKAKLLLADGSVVDVTYKNAQSSTADVGDIVSYNVDSDDVYTLTERAAAPSSTSGVNVENGKSAFTVGGTTYYANNNTVFLIRTNNATPYEYAAYVGYKNVPDVKAASGATLKGVVYKNNDTGLVDVVYLEGVSTSSASGKSIYVLKASEETVITDKGNTYTYAAVVDGEGITITATTQLTGGVYNSLSYNKDGQVTGGDPKASSDVKTASSSNVARNGVIGLGGQYYAYADDVVVYEIDGKKLVASAISAVGTYDTGDISVTFTLNSDGEVNAIYYEIL